MYWPQSGTKNTQATLDLAIKRLIELDLKNIIVASNSGSTANQLFNLLKTKEHLDLNIVCVTHHVGFGGPGVDEMTKEVREELLQKGIKVLTTTHLFAGLDRAVRNKFGGVYPAEIMAQTLRMLGQGIKVGVEIAGMAIDAGLIPFGEDVVAIGGTGRGVDSAIVIRPHHSNHFFETKIKEIICKPKDF